MSNLFNNLNKEVKYTAHGHLDQRKAVANDYCGICRSKHIVHITTTWSQLDQLPRILPKLKNKAKDSETDSQFW